VDIQFIERPEVIIITKNTGSANKELRKKIRAAKKSHFGMRSMIRVDNQELKEKRPHRDPIYSSVNRNLQTSLSKRIIDNISPLGIIAREAVLLSSMIIP